MAVAVRELTTTCPEETEAVGEALGRALSPGDLIGLVGELGTGKTCLVRGLARGLGIDPERVHSPTFVMINEYPGPRARLFHVDLYRLEGPQVDELSLRDVLYGEGVAAVEWFDRLPLEVRADALVVTLRHAEADRRAIRLEAHGDRPARLLALALGA